MVDVNFLALQTEPNSPVIPDSARDFLNPSFAPTDAQRRASVQSTEYAIRISPPVSFMIPFWRVRRIELNMCFFAVSSFVRAGSA